MADEPAFEVLKRSNKKPARGDIFTMKIDGKHLFGRVILADVDETAPMPGSYLVYIYRDRRDTPEPRLDALVPDNLLIAPLFSDRAGWTKGYFMTVENRPIDANDLLSQHCFRDYDGSYMDENGEAMPAPVEPCGTWGRTSYWAIAKWVSEALSNLRYGQR